MLIIFIFAAIGLLLCASCFWVAQKLFRKRLYFPLVAMLAFPFIAHETIQYYWYAKAIPGKFSITYAVSIYAEGGFSEGCGTIVFKLSDNTVETINKEGLKFFVGATEGRGHPGDRDYRYAEWKETPLPPSWTSEGSWMPCSGLSHSDHLKIVSAAKSGGPYYTTKDEGQLVVIPSLGYIVLSFFG
jgi:hypothetical protein